MPELSILELTGRIVGAALLGGLIGIEREFSEQVAGFRTHMIVSLGAALFTLAGAYGVGEFADAEGLEVQFDPTRVAAQIVTGIGFLGAGAILRQGITVRGLTTAAALWVTAAVGLAAGLGYWGGAVGVTIATVICLFALKTVEREILPRWKGDQGRYMVTADAKLDIKDLIAEIEQMGAFVERLRREEGGDDLKEILMTITLPKGMTKSEVGQTLRNLKGVEAVDWR